MAERIFFYHIHYIALLSGPELIETENARHRPNYERPDIFNGALLTFLNDEK